MIKYLPEDVSVTFAEIPTEITLSINLSLCIRCCPGCHSPYLQKDIGKELTFYIIDCLLFRHHGITCVLFLGGDNDKETLVTFAEYIRDKSDIKIGWYSGEDELDLDYYGRYFDYIKVGSYKKDLGGLDSPTTNQRLYKISKDKINLHIEDITNLFWKKINK